MINILLFLNHGGKVGIQSQQVPAGTSPIPAIIIAVIFIAIIVGLWILLSKKKTI